MTRGTFAAHFYISTLLHGQNRPARFALFAFFAATKTRADFAAAEPARGTSAAFKTPKLPEAKATAQRAQTTRFTPRLRASA